MADFEMADVEMAEGEVTGEDFARDLDASKVLDS